MALASLWVAWKICKLFSGQNFATAVQTKSFIISAHCKGQLISEHFSVALRLENCYSAWYSATGVLLVTEQKDMLWDKLSLLEYKFKPKQKRREHLISKIDFNFIYHS